MAKGWSARQLIGHKHHARNPEVDDVVPGYEYLGGEEAFEVERAFVWPPKRLKRPQRGAKPSV